jgi:TRAF3-interacting protein 1
MIDTPVLTEKLLSKPPFRFLHDIVTSMLRTRSWPEGYFDARECEPSNLVDLNSKLDFLEKLIDLLSIVNSVDLAHINPKKIVAGLEPDHTNQLLQEFAKAAASGITVPQITAMMEASEAGEPGTGVSYVPPPEVSPSPSPSAESVGAAEVAPGAGADAPLLGDAGAGASDAPSGSP